MGSGMEEDRWTIGGVNASRSCGCYSDRSINLLRHMFTAFLQQNIRLKLSRHDLSWAALWVAPLNSLFSMCLLLPSLSFPFFPLSPPFFSRVCFIGVGRTRWRTLRARAWGRMTTSLSWCSSETAVLASLRSSSAFRMTRSTWTGMRTHIVV